MLRQQMVGRLLGSTLGGTVGIAATTALWSRGLPFPALIGLGVGLGAGLLARSRSLRGALAVGVAGLAGPVLYLCMLSHVSLGDLLSRPILGWQIVASAVMAFVLGLGADHRRRAVQPAAAAGAPQAARG